MSRGMPKRIFTQSEIEIVLDPSLSWRTKRRRLKCGNRKISEYLHGSFDGSLGQGQISVPLTVKEIELSGALTGNFKIPDSPKRKEDLILFMALVDYNDLEISKSLNLSESDIKYILDKYRPFSSLYKNTVKRILLERIGAKIKPTPEELLAFKFDFRSEKGTLDKNTVEEIRSGAVGESWIHFTTDEYHSGRDTIKIERPPVQKL